MPTHSGPDAPLEYWTCAYPGCRLTLSWEGKVARDGSYQEGHWVHGIEPDEPHEPEPVPPGEHKALPVCDCCSRPGPRWTIVAPDYMTRVIAEGPKQVWDVWSEGGGWALCDDCKKFIDRDDWVGLADRTVDSIMLRQGRRDQMTRQQYRLYRREMFKAVKAFHVGLRACMTEIVLAED